MIWAMTLAVILCFFPLDILCLTDFIEREFTIMGGFICLAAKNSDKEAAQTRYIVFTVGINS